MGEDRRSKISKADTAEAMGEFWDTHDFTDFDTDAPDVQFEVALSVPIEDLADTAARIHQRMRTLSAGAPQG